MKQHILTVVVEDYFHVAALRGAIREKHWDRLEPRLEQNLDTILGMLRRHEAGATFFVYGLIAERYPHLVRRIVADGHEVASRGYTPKLPADLDAAGFRHDLARARRALEGAGANAILGYRAPQWLTREQLWRLDVLAEEGYVYDSSLNPVLRRFVGNAEAWGIHHHRGPAGREIWEFPITTVGALGMRLPVTGGAYLRQLPHTLLSPIVEQKSRRETEPLVFYLMTWELDEAQPDIKGIPAWQRVRHYRRLGKPRWVFQEYMQRYSFAGIADYLGLPHPAGREVPVAPAPALVSGPATGEPVTLVIPFFNESQTLSYLHRTLLEFRQRLSGRFRVHLVLVDDGSIDDTARLLREMFADVPDCTVVEHGRNRGVAAAILTGIRAAPTEVVCSIDSDLSYDPKVLVQMLERSGEVDMVTASPYHPEGRVVGVPAWRLLLSKTLSRMYSATLDKRMYTYTSCCRVYKKSAILALDLHHEGFLGVAEMLIELIRTGGRVAEHPAVLESRLLGVSKMKTGRTIAAHLSLLSSLAFPRKPRHPQ